MKIDIDETGHVSVQERRKLNDLHVSAPRSMPFDTIDSSLRSVGGGWTRDQHVWLQIAWLREHGHPDDPSWSSEFDLMIKYAADHGWLDGSSKQVRAHVQRTD